MFQSASKGQYEHPLLMHLLPVAYPHQTLLITPNTSGKSEIESMNNNTSLRAL